MDHPGIQQAWGCSAPLFQQQNHLVAQHGDDPENSGPPLTDRYDYEWNYVECSQDVTNAPSQAVPLFNPQPYSNPAPHSGLIRHWYAGHAASSSFGHSLDADLSMRAVDAEGQSPAKDQSFQQSLLPWPQPVPTAELNSTLIPYGDTNYKSISGFEQALTAGAALATKRLEVPHSKPRKKSLDDV